MGSNATEHTLLFLHRRLPARGAEEGAPIDLVLTPQLYHTRFEPLPLRFTFQAKKLAPSVFDENDAAIRYEVMKEGEGWRYFAYRPDEILSLLRERAIDPRQIRRLYFAQQFAGALHTPLLLEGSDSALLNIDGIVTLLPVNLLEEAPRERREQPPLPSRYFHLPYAPHDGSVPSRIAWSVTAAALLLAIAWFAEGIRFQRSASGLKNALQEELSRHPTLQSRLTRENIYEKYRKIDTQQRRIRETLRRIGTLVSKESRLDSLTVDAKGYTALLDAPGPKLSTLKLLASKAGLSARVDGAKLRIEGSWR